MMSNATGLCQAAARGAGHGVAEGHQVGLEADPGAVDVLVEILGQLIGAGQHRGGRLP